MCHSHQENQRSHYLGVLKFRIAQVLLFQLSVLTDHLFDFFPHDLLNRIGRRLLQDKPGIRARGGTTRYLGECMN
jgi:hypothetical protein